MKIVTSDLACTYQLASALPDPGPAPDELEVELIEALLWRVPAEQRIFRVKEVP
jgi:hypothetical protein